MNKKKQAQYKFSLNNRLVAASVRIEKYITTEVSHRLLDVHYKEAVLIHNIYIVVSRIVRVPTYFKEVKGFISKILYHIICEKNKPEFIIYIFKSRYILKNQDILRVN